MTVTASDQLNELNLELAAVLRRDPAELAEGADNAGNDELVICGILGGKDVGKSTLINALAKTRVSIDAREVGRGTDRPMAYAHADARSAVADRLRSIGDLCPVEVTLHNADAVRNVVLIDLPDFDSDFREHLRVVRAVAPLLDRVLWVQTPRKIADRIWIETFRDVVKDTDNVYYVLNKVDELLADYEPAAPRDDGARAFWNKQHEWVARSLAEAGYPPGDDHRFLVAAAFAEEECFIQRIALLWDDPRWSRYEADRGSVADLARFAREELDRLRACVLGPVSSDRARAIKRHNREREQVVNIARIRRHYDLDRTISRLEQVCDEEYVGGLLAESMGEGYGEVVAAALRTNCRGDAELADELIDRTVGNWPLLRLVYWPFGWLSRIVGRRLGPASDARRGDADDPFEQGGLTLADRIEQMRSRILSDHAVASRRLDIERELPASAHLAQRVTASGDRLGPLLDARLLDRISLEERSPSILAKAALWLILLWFPVLQPVLEGGLELYIRDGSLDVAHGLYRIVSAFSAVHLLSGFAVVTGIYVAVLAGMYARRRRAVRRLRETPGASTQLVEAVEDLLVREAVVPLITPFRRRMDQLTGIRTRLVALGKP